MAGRTETGQLMSDTKEPGQQPGKSRRQTKFSSTERDRIRAAILAYARETSVGVPTLKLHMEEKTGRTLDNPSQKTLQRFLAGTSFVNDGFVSWCAEFVAKAGTQTPHEMLAHELSSFFAPGQPGEHGGRDVPARFAAEYEIISGTAQYRPLKVISVDKSRNTDKPYGRCIVSGGGEGIKGHDAPNLKVHEVETGPGSGGTDGTFRPPANEGVVLYFEPLVFMLLRNNLTRLPRVYWLQEKAGGMLGGHAMHAVPHGSGSSEIPYSEMRNYELHPVAEKT